MARLPKTNCLCVAIATPLTPDYQPDVPRLVSRARQLLADAADGIALFGTTGEGAEFAVEDRIATLEQMIATGIDPERIIVSVGALAISDVVRLSTHATDLGVHGVLLMPPGIYRTGIGEEGTFRFFSAIIDRVARSDLRLYLYHFPDICGVPLTPRVIRRLDERYPGMIAGVKDSGGDLGFTQDLVRRFSHLSIFTGSEIHLPELLGTGLRGTICGLANVMPRLMRAMMDEPTAFDRRALLPYLFSGDAILSRRPFIPSAKAVIAAWLEDDEWRRVIPPLPDIPMLERQSVVADFAVWDARLPARLRSLTPAETPHSNVVGLRRA
ncbi:MAG: dihydrodipicolinate synthase family protein [Devosia sp.]|nr:dihydrodipicolinate synthase family protein [Devosia sp.]